MRPHPKAMPSASLWPCSSGLRRAPQSPQSTAGSQARATGKQQLAPSGAGLQRGQRGPPACRAPCAWLRGGTGAQPGSLHGAEWGEEEGAQLRTPGGKTGVCTATGPLRRLRSGARGSTAPHASRDEDACAPHTHRNGPAHGASKHEATGTCQQQGETTQSRNQTHVLGPGAATNY